MSKKHKHPSAKNISDTKSTNIKNPLTALILALVAYFAFSPSMKNGWTNWDDPVYVYENNMVMSEKTQWNKIFTEPVSLNYHPITMLTLSWNYQSAEKKNGIPDPKVFHQWNVVIHTLSVILMFWFILQLSGSYWAAALVAAVFGLHPMHVESVTWISERKDVLYVFFFLIGLLMYLRYSKQKNYLWLFLCFVFYVLSLLSKAVAVVFPVVLLLIDFYSTKKITTRQLMEKIPFFLLSFYFGWKAYSIQATGAIAKPEAITLYQQIIFGSYGAMMYVLKFFVPFKLSAFYPYPNLTQNNTIPMEYFSGLLIWPVTALLLIYGYKQNKHLLFGVLFYFITIGLVLQFISVGAALMADRYSYLPYAGLAFPLGMWLQKEWDNKTVLRMVLIVLLAIWLIYLSVTTYARTQVWKDNITLWSDVINKYPTVEVAYKNRGNYYGKELGKVEESYRDYMVLKRMNSKDTKVYSNMGNVYGLRNQPDSAVWCYNKAIDLDPNNEEAYINRGITYSMQKQYEKAIDDFIQAEKIKGISVNLLQNRAYTYLAAGRYAESVNDYNQLLMLKPNDGQTYFFSALANEGKGNYDVAKQQLQQAVALGYKVDEATRQRVMGR